MRVRQQFGFRDRSSRCQNIRPEAPHDYLFPSVGAIVHHDGAARRAPR
jgi:hypothetical protein